jgi:hypothetical protein
LGGNAVAPVIGGRSAVSEFSHCIEITCALAYGYEFAEGLNVIIESIKRKEVAPSVVADNTCTRSGVDM